MSHSMTSAIRQVASRRRFCAFGVTGKLRPVAHGCTMPFSRSVLEMV
ncbi:MAG TPA: hypothetical protein VFV38_22830 [Ktedonobacteraceae bacterium]|nr:hypothetical protein [Ktedonobacteraceae bacterium]